MQLFFWLNKTWHITHTQLWGWLNFSYLFFSCISLWINYILLGIKYDAEKEEKSLQDIKQKELSRIEEALQKAAEKGTVSLCFRQT